MIRFLPAIVAGLLAACATPPADPEGTLDRVRGGTLRVGFVVSDPWTTMSGGRLGGIEFELVERFAEEIDGDVEWTEGSEQELFGALELGQLDLVVGGLDAENPWSSKAAFTHPYLTTQVVVAVPASQDVPGDIAGLEISVEAHTEGAGVLEKTDAVVRPVADVAESTGAVAIDDYLVDDLELKETGVTLIESDHVMAVRLGENGLMVALERFSLENSDLVHELLDQEANP